MANRNKGEVDFEVDGKSYKLVYTANSLCDLEDQLNISVVDIGSLLGSGIRMKTIRAFMWAGLLEHHPETTIKQAGNIVQALTVAKAIDLVGKSIQLSFTEPEDRPQKPASQKDGTGPAS